MAELKTNTKIHLTNGNICTIKNELGRGGQGIVYRVDYLGKDYALKWYSEKRIIESNSFYNNLERNVRAGSPAPNFLWPIATTQRENGSYGYIMRLRPQGYVDMSKIMLTRAKFVSQQAKIKACLQICTAFQKLHIRGLSYQDMNDGNFMVNPQTGDVLICDNDNVAPDGIQISGILGKSRFMAPEIVEGKSMPNKYTDYFSLAVCLFIFIYNNRPFEGALYMRCPNDTDPNVQKTLYGFSSIFIMDPNNLNNRPVPGKHDNVLKLWSLYPSLLGKAFQRTFRKEAITDPTQRLMDKQWADLLQQIRSNCVKCPSCGHETFVDEKNNTKPCAWCKRPITFNSLNIGRYNIPLLREQPIYESQVTTQDDYSQIIGHVGSKNGVLGITNNPDSAYPWTVILPNNNVKVVNQGSGLPVIVGYKIKFGNQGDTGTII